MDTAVTFYANLKYCDIKISVNFVLCAKFEKKNANQKIDFCCLFIYIMLKSVYKSKNTLHWLYIYALRERIPLIKCYRTFHHAYAKNALLHAFVIFIAVGKRI
jgi:hypothetical protein